jgi:hypothetical protein
MKQLQATDYVLYDKANDNVVQHSDATIILYGSKEEAINDCYGNESAIPCTELPKFWRDIIFNQINNQ